MESRREAFQAGPNAKRMPTPAETKTDAAMVAAEGKGVGVSAAWRDLLESA